MSPAVSCMTWQRQNLCSERPCMANHVHVTHRWHRRRRCHPASRWPLGCPGTAMAPRRPVACRHPPPCATQANPCRSWGRSCCRRPTPRPATARGSAAASDAGLPSARASNQCVRAVRIDKRCHSVLTLTQRLESPAGLLDRGDAIQGYPDTT